MSFLGHLAAMAVGAKPATAARVSLPPRFAGPSLAHGDEQSIGLAEDTAPAAEIVRGQSVPPHGPPQAATPPIPQAVQSETSPPARTVAPLPVNMPVRRDRQAPSGPVLPPRSPPSSDTRRGMPRDVTVPSPVPAANRPAAAGILTVQSPAPPQMSPVRPVTRALPLSDAAVAGRAMAAREESRDERPVIHVTIDRLDVRAPASPASPAEKRRAKTQPTVSLADYLREGARGGRG